MVRTQDDSPIPVNWEFIHDASGKNTWTWRHLKIDGSIELTSSPLSDFGAAVGDALQHGFLPKEHHWVVTDKIWTTHFHPGSTPISIPSDGQAVKRTIAHRRAPAISKREITFSGK